jgi:hypothetical protein
LSGGGIAVAAEEIPEQVSRLRDDQIDGLAETLENLISHTTRRIEYAETRRTPFVVMAGALSAAGFTLATVAGSWSFLPGRLAGFFGGGVLFVTGAAIWVVHSRQTNFKYPFIPTTKTWKWFYRDALPHSEGFRAPWHTIQSEAARRAGKDEFKKQWPGFIDRQVSGLVDKRLSLSQDIQQLYVLYVNERYKNLFLSTQRSILAIGLGIAVLAGILGLGAGALIGTDPDVHSALFQTGDLQIRSTWRPTGAVRVGTLDQEQIQLLVNLILHNKGRDPLAVRGFEAIDQKRMAIPLLVERAEPNDLSLLPGQPVEFTLLVWLPSHLVDDLDVFEVKT